MIRALEAALDRLAAATGIRRVRKIEATRFEHHGDPVARRRSEAERAAEVRRRADRILP